MNKLLVILGPTASGKSDLAIKIAKLYSGEIVSADSRQVYQYLDLGSGKVPRDKTNNKSSLYLSQGIPHYLLDIVSPKKYFTVVQYQKLAIKAITEIQKRGKLPILCGGTGFYISAVIEGWQFPKIKPNKNLRKKLNSLSPAELFNRLKQLDPDYAKIIDKHNPRRIIRAIEIALAQGKVKPLIKQPPPWDIFILGIKRNKEELKERIVKRLEKRLKQGMVKEVQRLKQQGVSNQRLEDLGLEYRWINRYLEGEINYEQMKQKLLRDILKFAKRQLTWFKKIKNIHWVSNEKEALTLVNEWLNKKN